MKNFRSKLWMFNTSLLVTLGSIFLSLLNILRWTFGITLYPFLFVFSFISLRGSMRFNFHPDVVIINPDDIPFDIWLEFERNRYWLACDGFDYVCDMEISNAIKMKNDKVAIKLFFRGLVHRSKPVMAGIISAQTFIGDKLFESFEYVSFSSDARSGVFYETNNLSMPDPFPFLDGVIKHQFPDIDVPRHLYQLHLKVLDTAAEPVAARPYSMDKEAFKKIIMQHFRHEFSKYCEAGYTVDDGDGYASYTIKGVMLTAHRNSGVGKILFNRSIKQKYLESIQGMGIKLDNFMNTAEFTPVSRMVTGKRINSLHRVMALINPLVEPVSEYRLSSLNLKLKVSADRCHLKKYELVFYRMFIAGREVKMEQQLEFVYDNGKTELQELQGSVYEILTVQQEEQLAEAQMEEKEYEKYKKTLEEEQEEEERLLAEIREQEGMQTDEDEYDEENYDEEDVYQTLKINEQVKDLPELIPVILSLLKESGADDTQDLELGLLEGKEQQTWYGSFNAGSNMYQFNIGANTLEVFSCEGNDMSKYQQMDTPRYMNKMMDRISRQLDDMDD